jgi:hypothetical protein
MGARMTACPHPQPCAEVGRCRFDGDRRVHQPSDWNRECVICGFKWHGRSADDCPRSAMHDASSKSSDISAVCPTVEAVRAKLSARAALGLGKYGVTLADAGLTRLAALQHAQDEAMDLANYLEVLIQQEPKG